MLNFPRAEFFIELEPRQIGAARHTLRSRRPPPRLQQPAPRAKVAIGGGGSCAHLPPRRVTPRHISSVVSDTKLIASSCRGELGGAPGGDARRAPPRRAVAWVACRSLASDQQRRYRHPGRSLRHTPRCGAPPRAAVLVPGIAYPRRYHRFIKNRTATYFTCDSCPIFNSRNSESLSAFNLFGPMYVLHLLTNSL